MQQPDVQPIVAFCKSIISEETVGSRFEGNNTAKIWQLGDLILQMHPKLSVKDLSPHLRNAHNLQGVRYDDRLYRAAIIFRKYWDNEKDYLAVVKVLDAWTKLRELYPICDTVLSSSSKIDRAQVDELIKDCKGLTYLDTREVFKRFRRKDDALLKDLGIDTYELSDQLETLIERLHEIVAKKDDAQMAMFRKRYSAEQQRSFRLMLSAIQQETVYIKHEKELKALKLKLPEEHVDILIEISGVFSQVYVAINHKKARELLRGLIPTSDFGMLSTYLRALESDDNFIQYQKKQDLLNKFISQMSGK